MKHSQAGLALLEILIAVIISAILIAALMGLISLTLNAGQSTHQRLDTLQQARFAMQRMVRAVSKTRRLGIPLAEDPATAWSESVRPVLAVSLDPTQDRNKDGWADANNDKDFLDVNKNGVRDAGEPERIDEDTDLDWDNDAKPGIINIDDNGNGVIDEGSGAMARHDDDEDGQTDEDDFNNLDDDGDGASDEDVFKDMNGDGKAGIAGEDDDLDGAIDEGSNEDDDEDGVANEDWIDWQVFYLNGTTLTERLPNINAASGADYTEYAIAENVSQFRVERVPGADGVTALVDITLTLSPPGGEPVNLNTRVAVGNGL